MFVVVLIFMSIVLKSVVIAQQILTPDIRIYQNNDKFLYKYLPQVLNNAELFS